MLSIDCLTGLSSYGCHATDTSWWNRYCHEPVPTTIRDLHAEELRKLAYCDRNIKIPIRKDISLSGVQVSYAIPAYRSRRNVYALVDWIVEQHDEEEFADVDALNDDNCRLDFANFILKNRYLTASMQPSPPCYKNGCQLMRLFHPHLMAHLMVRSTGLLIYYAWLNHE